MLRRKHLATDAEIHAALDRVPDNHPGKPVIRELLKRPSGDLAATKSMYKRRLRRLLKLAKLPAPISNHMVEGEERDLVWLDRRLILEFDGWEWHKDKFEDDRRRDNLAIAAGWRVMRLTADRVDTEPYAVIAEIAAARAAAAAGAVTAAAGTVAA
jgi:very-short-patch-repair endonuclease